MEKRKRNAGFNERTFDISIEHRYGKKEHKIEENNDKIYLRFGSIPN